MRKKLIANSMKSWTHKFRTNANLHSCRVGEISETVAAVDFMNVHELGSANMKDPEKVAKHAAFMAANMLVAVIEEVRRSEGDCLPLFSEG